jgi:hypothetical protein
LLLAAGLGGKVAVLDAECGRSELYAEAFAFDLWRLSPPFTAQQYVWAINEAGRQGYSVCIVDGLSPAWSGEGGALSQVEAARSSFDAALRRNPWAEANHGHWRLLRALLESPCHVLVTVRLRPPRPGRVAFLSSSEGVLPQDRSRVDQKPGLEYEFTTALVLDAEHRAWPIKDCTGLFRGRGAPLSAGMGQRLRRWAEGGVGQESLPEALESVGRCSSAPELRRLWSGRCGAWKETPWFAEVRDAVWTRMQGWDDRARG